MTGYKNPPRRRTVEIQLQGLNATLRRLAAEYQSGRSWKAIGAEIGVSGPMVYRAVVRQIYPHDNAHRAALGLSLLIESPYCEHCGSAHPPRKTCPSANRAPRPRRPNRRKLALDVLAIIYGQR